MDRGAALRMARELVASHGLTGWRVQLDNAKRRAGVCRFDERVIGLSGPLTDLHSEADVRDTVLHEIAHALVGPAHGHDRVWRATAQRIGCSGKRCVDAESPRVSGAWIGTCPAGHVKDRHRRPERVMSCARCSPRFSVEHVFSWTFHGRPGAMHPNYEAELESLLTGKPLRVLPVGARVRITVPGEHRGRVGRVVRLGRTSYHVRVTGGLLRVAFAGVEPAR
jgi:predicted SprT family Zn-dependent metalloprotease